MQHPQHTSVLNNNSDENDLVVKSIFEQNKVGLDALQSQSRQRQQNLEEIAIRVESLKLTGNS